MQMVSANLSGSCAQDCLQAFTEREALGEDAGFKCSTCKRVQPATKQLTVRRCPPVLVLTLKRFSVSRLANAIHSCITKHMQAPDLHPFPRSTLMHAAVLLPGISSAGHGFHAAV